MITRVGGEERRGEVLMGWILFMSVARKIFFGTTDELLAGKEADIERRADI